MLQVVLIDDERCVLEELAYQLKGKVNIIGKFTNSLKAVASIADLAPDAIFLDIEMPELSGFETATEILALLPETAIIFVTAYSHHAVKAFELNAIDYLVKPVQPMRLQKSLERLEERLTEDKKQSQLTKLKNLLQISLTAECPDKIILWKGKRAEVIALEKIACCFVAKGAREVSVVAGGHIYHTTGNLHDFMGKIPTHFLLRCHRSYYLNPRWLSSFERTNSHTINAYLEGYPEPIPVSRAYRHTLIESIHKLNNSTLKQML